MAKKWRRGSAMSNRKKSGGGPLKRFSQEQEDRVPPTMTVRYVDPVTLRRDRRR